MKALAVLAGIACAVATNSDAFAAQVRFLGAFTVTSAKNCLGRYPGENFNSAFRPADVGDNPNFASITQLNQYSGDVYPADSGDFPRNAWKAVIAHGFDNQPYQFNARVKITFQSPAVILPSTRFVVLTGYIEGMGNDQGSGGTCVAGFRGSYFRRTE